MKKPVLDQSKEIQIQLDSEDDSNDWFFWPEEEGYLYKTYGFTEEDYEEMIIQALALCLEEEDARQSYRSWQGEEEALQEGKEI